MLNFEIFGTREENLLLKGAYFMRVVFRYESSLRHKRSFSL